jgi:menaquinone-dependent protoporphyrinogen oxidase
MNVLVAYGSKMGSTREIAEEVGDELRRDGLTVTVRPGGLVPDLEGFDAVVLGGALYAGRWHPQARRFARRFAPELRERPVWLFSSGPLDRSAEERDIKPVPFVAKLMAATCAQGHATFGGRLGPDAPGFIAGAMAKKMAGDYRDFDAIRAWAGTIAPALRRAEAAA